LGFRGVSIDFWAYIYALLGFYDRDGFIWGGFEPGNTPKYAHVGHGQQSQTRLDFIGWDLKSEPLPKYHHDWLNRNTQDIHLSSVSLRVKFVLK